MFQLYHLLYQNCQLAKTKLRVFHISFTKKTPSPSRRARACPSPAFSTRATQRSRGKPARMRVGHPRAPAIRKKNASRTVGRGPVPRQRPRNPTIAGDRPPRYEKITVHERSRGTGPRPTVGETSSFHRRARACPSPCLDLHGKRPGPACGVRAGRTIAGDRPPRYE